MRDEKGKLKKEELLGHFNEITKEYHQHCEWTADKYLAVEQIRNVIQAIEEKPDYSGANITQRPLDRKKVEDYFPEKREEPGDEITSKFPNVIKLLEEKIEEEKRYIKVGEEEEMPKMKKYWQKRVAEYQSVIRVLSVA